MFTFKPYEDSDFFGQSRDDIYQDLKNVFHFSVYCNELDDLDNKVYVTMNDNNILFLCESKEISDAGKGKVLASISLTNPKDTGYDLLYFAEHIKAQSLILKGNEAKVNVFIDRAQQVFTCFPFLEDKETKQKMAKCYNNPDRVFMRLCLLEFLLAVDTHDDIFAINPEFDTIRTKLRESKVYRLLCAKLRYCLYHYKGRNALNAEEYTFVVSKYADLLMNSDFNKMVPPAYYDEPRFFNNPEQELYQIVQRSDFRIVEQTVREKIKAYFLTKHAVIESFRTELPSNRTPLFNLYYFLMSVFVGWAVYSFLLFDEKSSIVDSFYSVPMWKWGGLVFFAIIGFFSYKMNNKSIVFHPKIIVALMMGWFTIAVSEDLIKSQLDLSFGMASVALVVVLFIVCMMLWGEIKQHSPYYKIRLEWPWKSKLFGILIYSMFWNIILGIVMQGLTYSSLLRTSGAIPNAVLGQLPNEVEMYKQYIQTCISMLDDYDRSMEGVVHDNGKADFNTTVTANSLDTSLYVNAYVRSEKKKSEFDFYRVHNGFFEDIKRWLNMAEENMKVEMSFNQENDSCIIKRGEVCRLLAYKAKNDTIVINYDAKASDGGSFTKSHNLAWNDLFLLLVEANKLDAKKKIDLTKIQIENNLNSVREIKNKLRVQMLNIDQFASEINNQDFLFNMVRVESDKDTIPISFKTDDYYLAYLGYDAIVNHKYLRNMKLYEDVAFPLYPRMLLFHSLIVLLIAFVGQLIISEKSVTEPL